MATLLSKIMSFNICIHTEILEKISLEVEIGAQLKKVEGKTNFRTSFLLIGQEMMILAEDHIKRVGINSWE